MNKTHFIQDQKKKSAYGIILKVEIFENDILNESYSYIYVNISIRKVLVLYKIR